MAERSRLRLLVEWGEHFHFVIWLYESAPVVFPALVAGATMSYLSSITDWLTTWGPIVWGTSFIIGGYSIVLGYSTISWIKSKTLLNSIASQAIAETNINPLDDRFDKVPIRLSSLYSIYNQVLRNKTFDRCQIYGPFNIVVGEKTIINKCNLRFCQVIIAREGPVLGAIRFDNTTIINSELFEITFIMNRATYEQICRNTPEFEKNMPVISEEYSGK